MLDLDYIRKNYSQLSDQKIKHLANFEANQLEPEVVEILLEEIKKAATLSLARLLVLSAPGLTTAGGSSGTAAVAASATGIAGPGAAQCRMKRCCRLATVRATQPASSR